jgi:hypothetical protein
MYEFDAAVNGALVTKGKEGLSLSSSYWFFCHSFL